jgi:hypothetical protein
VGIDCGVLIDDWGFIGRLSIGLDDLLLIELLIGMSIGAANPAFQPSLSQ